MSFSLNCWLSAHTSVRSVSVQLKADQWSSVSVTEAATPPSPQSHFCCLPARPLPTRGTEEKEQLREGNNRGVTDVQAAEKQTESESKAEKQKAL